jgi:hypothetical protein
LSKVFISYRRSDAGVDAGRLADALRPALRKGAVFRDVGGIEAGERFDTVLERELDRASHVIVLIGPNWLAELQRRMSQPQLDFVRFEVAKSLVDGKVIMPVLLHGATLPAAHDLPADLAGLTRYEAKPLRDDAWHHDVNLLLDGIGRPYRVGALALRSLCAVVAAGACLIAIAPGGNYDFTSVKRMFWGLLLAYACGEAAFAAARRRRRN